MVNEFKYIRANYGVNQLDRELWSDAVRGLVPYRPGEQPSPGERVIKLNTNENPYPPSPACLSALREGINADLRLYPDPEGRRLKETIAAAYSWLPIFNCSHWSGFY